MNLPVSRKQPSVSRPQKPVSKLLFFGSLGITFVCVLTLFGLALRGVPTTEGGYGPHLLIVLAFSIFVTASLAITEIIPWGSRSLRDWQRPKVLGSFVGLIMGGLGLAVGLKPLFDPPAATEKTVEEVRKRLEEAGVGSGKAALIEQHINGIWGEPGCQVTYGIGLDKGLLTIESQRSVAGQSPLRLELQAEPGRSHRLVASVALPLQYRGDQHEFLYERAGTRDFLIWVIKKRESSLKLDRC
jgi:hypothetical protein